MRETLSTAEQATPASGGLRHNNLGLRNAIVISVAVMSPAASIFFNTPPTAKRSVCGVVFPSVICSGAM